MFQAVILQPVTARNGRRSQLILYGIFDVQYGSEQAFLPGTSIFLCQYNSTSAPYSHLITVPPTLYVLEDIRLKANRSMLLVTKEIYSFPCPRHEGI
jgi:hypothetical protein